MQKIFLASLIFFGIAPNFAMADHVLWDLNDVTILYPLPSSNTETSDQMIGFLDHETGAQFLPTDRIFNRWSMERGSEGGPFVFTTGFYPPVKKLHSEEIIHSSDVFNSLRVVGVRIDPCFKDLFEDKCRHQIRFTWQPIMLYQNVWVAIDSSLHSFYDLNDSEWSSMLKDLNRLRRPYASLTKGQPLQPHPTLVKEGLDGPFAKGLRQLLAKYAGGKTPARVTEVNPIGGGGPDGSPGTTWDLRMIEPDIQGKYNYVKNQLVIKGGIPGASKDFEDVYDESVASESPDGKEFITRGVVATLKSGVENLLDLIRDSASFQKQAKPADIQNIYRTALRIQQPSLHKPNTTDCVSCHLSTAAQYWAQRSLSKTQIAEVVNPIKKLWVNTSFNFKNISPQRSSTRNMRALGYQANTPAINNRTIFESADVADTLNQSQSQE